MSRAAPLATPPSPIPGDARCLIYMRVSTEEQAKEDRVSLQVQERDCRAFAAKRGFPTPALWPADSESGRSTARLERLVGWCEAHPRRGTARGLIVALRSDRWGRFVHDEHASDFYQHRLAKAGWDLDFALEPKSDNTMVRKVTAVLSEVQAAAESEEKGRRAYEGMRGQAAQHRWMGRAPFGYTRVAISAAGTKRTLKPFERAADGEYVQLAEDTPAARTVRLIFRRACEGATCKAIAAELNAASIPGPFDVYRRTAVPHARKWRGGTVRTILKNPAYGGIYVWNRRHTVGKKASGADDRVFRPSDEWTRVEGGVLALIDRPTFKAVEAEFTKRKKQAHRIRNTIYLLSGLATCGRCGHALVGGGGSKNRCYKCSASDSDKAGRGECGGERIHTVNQVALETLVVERVAERVGTLVQSGGLAKTLDRLIGTRPDGRQARTALEQERTELEGKRNRLEDAVLDGTLSKERGKVKLAELEAALRRVDTELHELRLEPSRTDLAKERDRLIRLAADFPARLRGAPAGAARALLGQWLAGLVVHPSARKGGDLQLELTLRCAPAVGSQLAIDTPARRAAGKRCWPGDSPRSCRR